MVNTNEDQRGQGGKSQALSSAFGEKLCARISQKTFFNKVDSLEKVHKSFRSPTLCGEGAIRKFIFTVMCFFTITTSGCVAEPSDKDTCDSVMSILGPVIEGYPSIEILTIESLKEVLRPLDALAHETRNLELQEEILKFTSVDESGISLTTDEEFESANFSEIQEAAEKFRIQGARLVEVCAEFR